MNKRIFILLVVLMGIALIGIITVQVFWIKSTVKMREQQFSTSVKFALTEVSKKIKDREFSEYVQKYSSMIDSARQTKSKNVKDFFFKQIDTARNQIFTFRQSIVENNFKTQISPFDTTTVNFKTFYGREEMEMEKIEFKSKDFQDLSPKEKIVKMSRLDRYDKLAIGDFFINVVSQNPIYDRVSIQEITLNLDNELSYRNIDTQFEFGIFSDGLLTKVKTEKFKKKVGNTYAVPFFTDDNGEADYDLYVTFPEKKNYILATIARTLMLSALFILIIIIAFGSAIYQLIKQKQISEIKTDFINNMTHEFKTPIATINLAVDSIKNPKILGNPEKVIRYANMIKEENKRMHKQVENVLRISKLEKNQLDLSKETLDLHDIIEEAIEHVSLIIADKKGSAQMHLNAEKSEVLASEFHFTNVITNILDNAIKYSEEAPEIDVFTENEGNNILLKIKDRGIGMNKNVQRKVFNKFYREQTGNIHNVKGHGLGLSYVKNIVEKHQGNVSVESEKGIGTTFTVKIPTI